jgi:hypothetical protein
MVFFFPGFNRPKAALDGEAKTSGAFARGMSMRPPPLLRVVTYLVLATSA